MNSPILPVDGVDGPSDLSSPITPAVAPADGPAADVGAFIAELAAGENALSISARRGGPPPEVLDQIAAAARIEKTLRADGQRLRFHTAPGQVTKIELDELDELGGEGKAVRTLSVAEALDIATGAAPR
jgi:hypothetical protein